MSWKDAPDQGVLLSRIPQKIVDIRRGAGLTGSRQVHLEFLLHHRSQNRSFVDINVVAPRITFTFDQQESCLIDAVNHTIARECDSVALAIRAKVVKRSETCTISPAALPASIDARPADERICANPAFKVLRLAATIDQLVQARCPLVVVHQPVIGHQNMTIVLSRSPRFIDFASSSPIQRIQQLKLVRVKPAVSRERLVRVDEIQRIERPVLQEKRCFLCRQTVSTVR
jgi:hypothetical protein